MVTAVPQLSADSPVVKVAALLLLQRKQLTRYAAIDQLHKELGNTEETAHLIDHLEEAWETIDLLKDNVGAERALAIILCGWVEKISVRSFEQETKDQKLEEFLREALDMMSLIDPGESASSKWLAARNRLVVQVQALLEPDKEETRHECTARL